MTLGNQYFLVNYSSGRVRYLKINKLSINNCGMDRALFHTTFLA